MKYRVWDNENNKYFEPTYKAHEGDVAELLININGQLMLRTFNQISHESMFPGRFIIERCMDKAGFYEGDIIEFEDTGEEGYEYKEGFDFINRASITFKNYRWELENFISNNSSVLYEMNDCHEDFINVFSHCKVIGNIRENLELLKIIKELEEE